MTDDLAADVAAAREIASRLSVSSRSHDQMARESIESLAAHCERLAAERDDLARRAREVTCVWCGHQFVTTLQSQADELHQHAKACEKHPIRKAEAERDEYRRRMQEAESQLSRIAHAAGGDARKAPDTDRTVAGFVVAELDALRARVAELEAGLRWTTERPTVPGWYWVRSQSDGDRPDIARVYQIEGGGVLRFDLTNGIVPLKAVAVDCQPLQWAGPLPTPA